MEILQVTKERSGFVCFIALFIVYMVSMVFQISTFDPIGQITEANSNILGGQFRNGNTTTTTATTTTTSLTGSEGKCSSRSTCLAIDKLLGGLLASGFDEESCISRYQSYLYRRTSPHKPSPYLVSKLRKYEHLHQRCGPYSESYNRTTKLLSCNSTGQINSATTNTECNYIVWTPFRGLGNRIVSTASSFLYALLTNRVLLVDHGSDMVNLFCEPFPNTSWLLPMDFPLRSQFYGLQPGNVHSFGNLMKNRRTNISSTLLRSPSFLYLYLASNYGQYDELFYQDQNQGFLREVPWLILKSDQYFVPQIFLIPSFKRELDKLFPDKETVFHHLGRYLFHPSNQAWGLITRFCEAYLARADEKIGIQIRLFDKKASPSNIVLEQILACTHKQKLLPPVVDKKPNYVAPPSKNQTLKAITIASLHPEYYESIKNMYWLRPTATGEIIGVYQPSHEEVQHFGNDMHNLKAWAEMYVLSLSDSLVTSSWSTFGYVAQGLGGLKPWILPVLTVNQTATAQALAGLKPWMLSAPTVNQTINDPCLQAMSMEPCFHRPPGQKANIRSENNLLDPHVRHCEDARRGLKLVNDRYNY